MMRGLGILMLVVGAVFLVALPYYQQHFTNFVITEQAADAADGKIVSFQVALAPNDAPVSLVVTSLFSAYAATLTGRMTVPLTINGPNGNLVATSYEVTRNSFDPVDNLSLSEAGVPQQVHQQTISDITIDQNAVYTVTIGPIVDEGMPAQTISVALRGRTVAPWPDIDALSWALIGVGGFAVLFGGRRKTRQMPRSKTSSIGRRPSAQPKQPEKPKQKWGRDA